MATVNKGLARRNTAVVTGSLVESPCLALLRDEVPEGAMIFSFDPTSEENEDKVFDADANGTKDWVQHTEHPFSMVHWVAKRILMPRPDSTDVQPCIRIVLIDSEGETISFVSIGIAASLDLIRTLRGDGPYDPPIPVVFARIKTSSGRQTIKMRPIPVAPPVKPKAK